MIYINKYIIIGVIHWIFFIPVFLEAQDNGPLINKVKFCIQHISDIDLVKDEYKLELWLKFSSVDTCSLKNLEQQIAIQDSKDMTVDVIPSWNQEICVTGDTNRIKRNNSRKELKIQCTMIQKWNLDRFPFDHQTLNIKIYNAARIMKYVRLQPADSILNYNDASDIIRIENGWVIRRNDLQAPAMDSVADPFKSKIKGKANLTYSAINYPVEIFREHPWLLFSKLLLGMYVAFFVAFIALFIDIHETHPSFDLPVGGLFAAIANKYIIESILPQSSRFTLVDKLHSITIISILVIIAYSAFTLFLTKKRNKDVKKLDKYFIWALSIIYLAVNLAIIGNGSYAGHFHNS
jgi:hypothetical protein